MSDIGCIYNNVLTSCQEIVVHPKSPRLVVATAVGMTTGTVLQIITTSAVRFNNSGNMTFNAGATSLNSSPNELVIAVWDGSKWRVR